MTKRNFIKKSIAGMAGLLFGSSFQKAEPIKEDIPQKSSAYAINGAFGHSLPHSQFMQDHESLDFIS